MPGCDCEYSHTSMCLSGTCESAPPPSLLKCLASRRKWTSCHQQKWCRNHIWNGGRKTPAQTDCLPFIWKEREKTRELRRSCTSSKVTMTECKAANVRIYDEKGKHYVHSFWGFLFLLWRHEMYEPQNEMVWNSWCCHGKREREEIIRWTEALKPLLSKTENLMHDGLKICF